MSARHGPERLHPARNRRPAFRLVYRHSRNRFNLRAADDDTTAMRRVVGMRAGVVVAALAIVAAVAVGVGHESSNTQHRPTRTSGSETASAPRVVAPPHHTELRGVLADWSDANPHAVAVVGVQVGSRAA